VDIIARTSNLFPKVIVAVTDNVNKKHFFSLKERVNLLREATGNLKNVKIVSFFGLLSKYLDKINSFILIRGLRVISDFEYEFQMALINRKLNNKIETVFLIPDQSYTFLSSSMVKEIAMLGASTADFVPKCVHEEFKKRISTKSSYKNSVVL
jgi:pantetheine-phosphate adenylyltransferase